MQRDKRFKDEKEKEAVTTDWKKRKNEASKYFPKSKILMNKAKFLWSLLLLLKLQ